MIKRTCFLFLFLGVFITHCFAQKNATCINILQSCYNQWAKDFENTQNKKKSIKYNLTAKAREKQSENTNIDCNFYSFKNRQYYIDNRLQVFQDNFVSVTIIDGRKEIYIFDNVTPDYAKQSINRMKSLQDSMLNSKLIKVLSCNNIENGNYLNIVIDPGDFYTKRTGIKSINYTLNNKNKSIIAVKLNYLKGSYISQEFKFKNNKLSKTELEMLDQSPLDIIYKDKVGSRLRIKYKGYIVYDKRNKLGNNS